MFVGVKELDGRSILEQGISPEHPGPDRFWGLAGKEHLCDRVELAEALLGSLVRTLLPPRISADAPGVFHAHRIGDDTLAEHVLQSLRNRCQIGAHCFTMGSVSNAHDITCCWESKG